MSLCLARNVSGALQVRLGELTAITGLRVLSIQGSCSWGNDALAQVRILSLYKVTMQHTEGSYKRMAAECAHASGQIKHCASSPPPSAALKILFENLQ